jgi:hypothetical protein
MGKNTEPQFSEYKGIEIMFEPNYKKWYANEQEFNSLSAVKEYIDAGRGNEISNKTRFAYSRGAFAKGGNILGKNFEYSIGGL